MIGRTLGWFGRTLVLVLSMLATLSIIGSIAAIPSGSVGARMGLPTQALPPLPRSIAEPGQPRVLEAMRDPNVAPPRETIAVPAPLPPPDLLRWLEPLTYGVVALAGLMAIAVLLLWRAVTLLAQRR